MNFQFKRKAIRPLAILISFLLLGSCVFGFAAEIPWRSKSYTHIAKDQPLRSLLINFCSNQGITAVVSEDVEGTVNGRFPAQSPKSFFKQMTSAYGLIWYYDGNVLFIYRSEDMASRILTLKYLQPDKLQAVLNDVGIYDSRFPLKVINSQGLVFVTGPARYVTLVEETARTLDENQGNAFVLEGARQTIQVFPLKHAWADDMTFELMDREVVIPGVVSVLINLLNGRRGPTDRPQQRPRERRVTNAMESLRGKGLAAAYNSTENLDEEGEYIEREPVQENEIVTPGPMVQADVRLNAVIIRDKAENMPYYQSLIQELDVPAGLVEIQARIIDVDIRYSKDVGVDWRLERENDFSGGFGGGRTDSNDLRFGNQPLNVDAGLSFTTIFGNAARNFLARIRALEENGDAHTQARPSVLTLNNIEAQLEHSQTFFIRVAGEREVDLFPVTVGVVLKVTPHTVVENGVSKVKLAIKVEDGSLTDLSVDNIPVITRTAINTQAVVDEGASLLIGGYILEEHTELESRVPGLGKVPVVRHLFRRKEKGSQQRERLFLITPRILSHATYGQDPGAETGLIISSEEETASVPTP